MSIHNKILKALTNPNELYYESGFVSPKNGYISKEARLKARKKKKKKKK